MFKNYDVIVVGAGHAGCEAVLAAARLGCKTLLVTLDKEKIGLMSCNPAIGGVGKGQLVREVDALGGEMGQAADANLIQFRMLNASRGYAARSSRGQIDLLKYNSYMCNKVLSQDNLQVLEDEARSIYTEHGTAKGVVTLNHGVIMSKSVVLTPGTFLNGTIHIGLEHQKGGRIGENASFGLSESLARLGLRMMRLKTGTTPRLAGKTINFTRLKEQDGDKEIIPFSFWTENLKIEQKPCFITHTNPKTHEIIRKNLDRSPLYTGKIKSTGVRYCPSVEDKIVKFPGRESHTVFLEPEGRDVSRYYPNGISTSLPLDTQEKIVHSIEGLEEAEIVRPGYGIEYDIVDPTELKPTLEAKNIPNLFLAGQINGTTGYEEAASLGLMAGINASMRVKNKPPLILRRDQSYIGVLIDDLVTKGTDEPYRMFTSRVEYRLTVREDNAARRLGKIGYSIGLLPREKFLKIENLEEKVKGLEKRLKESRRLSGLLKRPGVSFSDIADIAGWREGFSYYERTQIEVRLKYEGYIKRELANIDRTKKIERINIPEGFDYSGVSGLSREIKEKLTRVRPFSLGQASRISGVTPAAVTLLMVKIHADKG